MSARELGAASASFLGVTNPRMDRWSAARALGTPRGVALADPAARASASFAGVLAEPPRSNRATSSGSAARTSSARTARVCGLAAKYARSFSICGRSSSSSALGAWPGPSGAESEGSEEGSSEPADGREAGKATFFAFRTSLARSRARAAAARSRGSAASTSSRNRQGAAPLAPAIFLIAVAANCAAPGAARDRSHSSSSGSSFSRTRGSGIWQ